MRGRVKDLTAFWDMYERIMGETIDIKDGRDHL